MEKPWCKYEKKLQLSTMEFSSKLLYFCLFYVAHSFFIDHW